jgi:HEPN domain-containing protein
MTRMTRRWVLKAESDWLLAVETQKLKSRFHDAVCFHCQQSAEKYLKSLIQECGTAPRRTHDLTDLLTDLLPAYPALGGLRRRLNTLTKYAVQFRYPGFDANARQARAALRAAEQVRFEIRKILGLKDRRPKEH